MSEEDARDNNLQTVENATQEKKANKSKSSSFLNISTLQNGVGKKIKQSPRSLLKQRKKDPQSPITTEDVPAFQDSEISSTETTVATSGENQTDAPTIVDSENKSEEKPEIKKKSSLTQFLFGSNSADTTDTNIATTDVGIPKTLEIKKSARASLPGRKLGRRSSTTTDSAPPPIPAFKKRSKSKSSDEEQIPIPSTKMTSSLPPLQDDVRKLLDDTSTTLENTTVMDMLCAMMESVRLLAQEQKRYNEEKDTMLLKIQDRLEQINATLLNYSELIANLNNETENGSETSARLEKIEAKLINLEGCMRASIVGIKSIANHNCNAVEVLNSTLLDNLERRKRLRNIKDNAEGK